MYSPWKIDVMQTVPHAFTGLVAAFRHNIIINHNRLNFFFLLYIQVSKIPKYCIFLDFAIDGAYQPGHFPAMRPFLVPLSQIRMTWNLRNQVRTCMQTRVLIGQASCRTLSAMPRQRWTIVVKFTPSIRTRRIVAQKVSPGGIGTLREVKQFKLLLVE